MNKIKTPEEVALVVYDQMVEEGIDTTGWYLDEIPIKDAVYIIENKKLKQCFTVNQNTVGQISYHYYVPIIGDETANIKDAETIKDAIKNDRSWEDVI